jgi:hypothetical protein
LRRGGQVRCYPGQLGAAGRDPLRNLAVPGPQPVRLVRLGPRRQPDQRPGIPRSIGQVRAGQPEPGVGRVPHGGQVACAQRDQGGDVARWLRDLVVRRFAHVPQRRAQLAVDLVVLPAHRGEFGAQLPEKGAELPFWLAG